MAGSETREVTETQLMRECRQGCESAVTRLLAM